MLSSDSSSGDVCPMEVDSLLLWVEEVGVVNSSVEVELGVSLLDYFLVSFLKVLWQNDISVLAYCLHTGFLSDSSNVST